MADSKTRDSAADNQKQDEKILPVIDGELLDESGEENTLVRSRKTVTVRKSAAPKRESKSAVNKNNQAAIRLYVLLPFIFLTVALLGGLRLSDPGAAFIFLKPPLICLVFAAATVALFFRTRLIQLENWFADEFTTLKNVANFTVLFSLFAASTQIYNALLPERGMPFWIIGLLFLWTLWNNLFSVFTAKKLIQSLGGLFALAFVLKYLVLANLTAPANDSWWKAIVQNPSQEFFTYLLDLPRFSGGTGYIQFFTVIFYVVGLALLSPSSSNAGSKSDSPVFSSDRIS